MYVHSGMHFCRYFNEFEKINTDIYIVFQIDYDYYDYFLYDSVKHNCQECNE